MIEQIAVTTPSWMKQWRPSSRVVGLVAFAVLILIAIMPPFFELFERLELFTFDTRQARIQEDRTQKSPISIIEIDEESISSREIKQAFDRYPFRREIFAYMVRFLERSHAKRLVMDMAFTGGSDLDHPESDKAFAQSLRGKLPVTTNLATLKHVPPVEYRDFEDHDLEKLDKTLSQQWLSLTGPPTREVLGMRLPNITFAEASFLLPSLSVLMDTPMAMYPFENLVYDLNGKARWSVLFTHVPSKKGVLPTLPLSPLMDQTRQVMIEGEGKLILGEHKLDLKGDALPLIRWYGNALKMDQMNPKNAAEARVYPRYSFWRVVKSQIFYECQQDLTSPVCKQIQFKNFKPIDPMVFQGRYVFLGLNTISYDMDNHPTLYDSSFRKYPGVIIQANILDNILHNEFVGRPGWRVPLPEPLIRYLERSQLKSVSLMTLLTVMLMVVATFWVVRWRSIVLAVTTLVCVGVIYHGACQWAYEVQNLWLNWVYPMTALITSFILAFTFRLVESEKKKQQLRIAFGKYFPKDILDQILKDPDKITLGGKRLSMTFLFCDIRGFTHFAEQNDVAVVQGILNEYYTTMHGISREFSGTAFKFLGDGILTFWGFPNPSENDALLAVKAALAMQRKMSEWRQANPDYDIRVGIGINSGDAFFGNVGTEEFMDFTVIGDNVNLAARLESLNKEFNTSLLISASTYQDVKHQVIARSLGAVQIRGKEEPIEVYEVTSLKPDNEVTPALTQKA
jgi:class 3 adenylate cyclase/CHASE2 domain-containing sensor protein